MAHRFEVFVARGGAWHPAELVSGTVETAFPNSPTNVTVSKTPTSATLAWAAPADTTVTGYRVGRDGVDSGGGGAWSTVLPATQTSIEFLYLVTGSTYGLYVITITPTGESAAVLREVTLEASATPDPGTATADGTTGAFLDALGITMHANYASDVNATAHAQALVDLGAKHWRDGGPNDAVFREKARKMSLGGAKGTVTVDPRDGNTPANVVQYIKDLRAAGALIERVEMPNEHDVNVVNWTNPQTGVTKPLWKQYDGDAPPTDASHMRAFAAQMYAAVKGDPATADVIVSSPSVAHPEWTQYLGDISAWIDELNIHAYQGGALPDDQLQSRWINNANLMGSTTKPVFASETGYHLLTSLSGQPGITMNAAKKYIPRLFCDYWHYSKAHNRQVRASLYNLSNDQWSCLLTSNNVKTPAYFALRDMIALLADPGEDFTPAPVTSTINLSASGDLKAYPLSKRDGTEIWMIWRNAKSVNQGALTDITVPRVNVTVTALANRTGTVYRPSTAGQTADGSTSGTSHVVAVGDEITMLFLAGGAPAAATAPAAPSLSLTSTSSAVTSTFASNGNGGSALTGWVLQRRTYTDGVPGSYSTIATPTAATLSYVDSAISTGFTYGYRLAAVNNIGTSTYSTERVVTPGAAAAYTPMQMAGASQWWPARDQGVTTDGSLLSVLDDKVGTRDLTSSGLPYRANGLATGRPSIGFEAPVGTGQSEAIGQASSTMFNGLTACTVGVSFKATAGAVKGFLFGKLFTLALAVRDDGAVQLLAGRNAEATGWQVNTFSVPGVVTMGVAQRAVVVYNGSTVAVRVNGAQVASADLTGALPSLAHGFAIGAANESGAEVFHGQIGEVTVSSQALAGTDLASLETYLNG